MLVYRQMSGKFERKRGNPRQDPSAGLESVISWIDAAECPVVIKEMLDRAAEPERALQAADTAFSR